VLYEFSAAGLVLPPRTQLDWQIRDLAFGTAGQLLLLDGTGHRLVTQLDRVRRDTVATPVEVGAVALAARPGGAVRLLMKPTGTGHSGQRRLMVDGNTVTELARSDFPAVERGWFDHPVRIDAAPDGSVLVVDILGRVERFAPGRITGGLGQWSGPGLQEALLDGNRLYVVRLRTPSADDPSDPDGAPSGQRRYRVTALDLPQGLVSAVDAEAPATVAWQVDWNEPLAGAAFTQIEALALDRRSGRLFALDAGHRRIMAWDARGQALPDIPLTDPGTGPPGYTDMAVAPEGRLMVLHSSSRQVIPVTPDGNGSGAPIDVGAKAYRLAIATDGRLVALAGNRRVRAYDPAGGLLHELPLPAPSEPGGEASDVAVDGSGRILVADYDPRAVHVFEPRPNGQLLLPFVARQP
jgi:hypothetical protein